MAQVALRNIVKTFDKTPAVQGIDLDIADREFIVLVGPSGCGKSTTLRMIAGLEEATSGEIYIGDQLVNDVPPKDRDIAMVFQNYALYPHMTVFENMSFGLRLTKFPKAAIREHDQVEAMTLADRVVIMNAVRIDQIGSPHEVYHTPKTQFVAGFIGSPTMNMLPCRLVENGSGLTIRLSDWLSLPVPPSRVARYRARVGGELTFGLRPEHIIEGRGGVPPGAAAFEAPLDVVEPMGMETMVYFIVDGVEVCGRVNPAAAGRVGESMRLVADLNQMHLIDPRTQQVI